MIWLKPHSSASLADETPEGRSIVLLAKEKYGLRGDIGGVGRQGTRFVPFSAQTRMSGVDMEGLSIRKGAVDAISAYLQEQGKELPPEVRDEAHHIARAGGTPLAVVRNGEDAGSWSI